MNIQIIGNEILFPRDSAGAAIAMDYLHLLRKINSTRIKITSLRRSYRREFLDIEYIGGRTNIDIESIVVGRNTISLIDELKILKSINKDNIVIDVNLRSLYIPLIRRNKFIKIIYHKSNKRYIHLASLLYDKVITTYNYNDKTVYIPPPINTDFFRPLNNNPKEILILYIGPLFHPRFPMRTILDSLVKLNKIIDYKAIFYTTMRHHTDKIWIKEFKNKVNKLQLTNVRILNKILSEKEKLTSYDNATMLLYTIRPVEIAHPPISVLEAMSCGTPVIISSAIGFNDVADKRLIVDINSSDNLVSSILYVVDNYKELSTKSRKIVEKKYSYRNLTDKVINILET